MELDEVMFGRFRLIEEIGAGGMGKVWRAEDTQLHGQVALKRISFTGLADEPARRQGRERTLREARAATRVRDHHGVITIYDYVEDTEHDAVWLVLEYLPSRSLAEVVHQQGRLDAAEVARIGAAVAEALAAGHAAGVVHRDIKPANVLLGSADVVKLTDFGISHLIGTPRLTATGQFTGSVPWASPEWARDGTTSEASDVFSLGATLYHAVEGEPPFGVDDNPVRLMGVVRNGEIRQPTAAGPLAPLLLRLLEIDPATRPDAATAGKQLDRIAVRLAAATEPHTGDLRGDDERKYQQAGNIRAAASGAAGSHASALGKEDARGGGRSRRRHSWWPLAAVLVVAVLMAAGGVIGGLLLTRPGPPSVVGAAPVPAPTGVAITPDGGRAYVTSYYSPGSVSVIDTATNITVASIPVGSSPTAVAISPDGARAYVANYGSATISVIDTGTNTVIADLTVGARPIAVTLTPDGQTVYVANYGSGTASVINTATGTVRASISVGAEPGGIAVSPDGARAYVANYGTGTVSVINTSTNSVDTNVRVGTHPYAVATSPDGRRVYVTFVSGYSNALVALDTATNTPAAYTPVGAVPKHMAVSPDGSTVYVANTSGTLSVVDTDKTTAATLSVDAEPNGLAVSPDNHRVYVANHGANTASVVVTGR